MTKSLGGFFGVVLFGASAMAGAPTLVPIGGDYYSVTGFSKVVVGNASGRTVDIAVLPTPYAETRAEAIENGDYELALEHVAELQAACESVVTPRFVDGCRVTLVELWVRADAGDAAIAESLRWVDGVFILGGDQGAAMEVLAGTLAERTMAANYERGGVIGGTSAGNAVLSATMNDGYTDYGDSSVALQLGALDIWFSTDPLRRGLSFGSKRAVFDQHMYERGRFGRLLNETARVADHFGRGGLVVMGADVDTAPVVRNDRHITSLFGPSSVSIVDFKTLHTKWAWVGVDGRAVPNPTPERTPTAALAARDVLVQVLAPKTRDGKSEIEYDFETRVPSLRGRAVPAPHGSRRCDDDAELTSSTPLIVGGDLSVGPNWPEDSLVLRSFISHTAGTGPVIIVAAGYDSADDAQTDLDSYSESLTLSGWSKPIVGRIYPALVSNDELSAAAGVLFLGSNQSVLPTLLGDSAFVSLVRAASRRSPVLMFDRSISALAGDLYDAVADEADWVESWKASQADVRPGLKLVRAKGAVAFEPRLAYDYRHGRLFGIPFAAQSKRPAVFGISEGSALVITSRGARVVGENPVIRSDTDQATFFAGDSGAFGVLNAVLDIYEPSQRTSSKTRFNAKRPSAFEPRKVEAGTSGQRR